MTTGDHTPSVGTYQLTFTAEATESITEAIVTALITVISRSAIVKIE